MPSSHNPHLSLLFVSQSLQTMGVCAGHRVPYIYRQKNRGGTYLLSKKTKAENHPQQHLFRALPFLRNASQNNEHQSLCSRHRKEQSCDPSFCVGRSSAAIPNIFMEYLQNIYIKYTNQHLSLSIHGRRERALFVTFCQIFFIFFFLAQKFPLHIPLGHRIS